MTHSTPLVVDPVSHHDDYRACAVKWWKWLLSIPKSVNPVSDSDGSHAHVMQNNPNFFFLCQTFESADCIPKRSVRVPSGKRIFMPILNWISVNDRNESDEELLRIAHERMDNVGKLEIYINGRQVIDNFQKYRVQSPFFELVLCADNILNVDPQNTRMISDGYWIMLEPISEQITINSFGACSSGATQISANYEITIC
jgi:hypothetical protein